MDDAIKRALEVATQKACNCNCAQLQPGCLAQVADEIAAFLDAVPRYEEVTGNRASYWPDILAAAVRRAAG
jgi:hypothetical protein